MSALTHRFIAALCLIVALGPSRPLASQSTRSEAAPPAAPIAIPLETYGSGALRKIKVVVAGDTLDFLFDTGGGVTIISPALAARIGCTPSGRNHGYRMTGEHLEAPVCRQVPLEMGAFRTTTEASVLDLMKFLGPSAPPVHGMISLRTFERLALTLDLTGGRLVVESPRSLAGRVHDMTPLRVRLATGLEGGDLTAYIGVPAGDAELWFEWDSGHQGTTFVAPWAARLLGMSDSAKGGEPHLALAPALRTLVPVEVKEVIHDGVLNGATVARATWTIDLAAARMWVGPIAPLLEAPAAAQGDVVPPTADPAGWYDVVLVVNGDRQRSIMEVTRNTAGLSARLRFVGSEQLFELRSVRADGGRLEFELPMRQTYPVRLTFDGPAGTGTWGDPATRGGAAEARKRG